MPKRSLTVRVDEMTDGTWGIYPVLDDPAALQGNATICAYAPTPGACLDLLFALIDHVGLTIKEVK